MAMAKKIIPYQISVLSAEGLTRMIPIHNLFETHLTVSDLRRSMAFYGDALGLELAQFFPERRVAFYWIGGRGSSMLGLWEVGTRAPAPEPPPGVPCGPGSFCCRRRRPCEQAGIAPLDFDGHPTDDLWCWLGCRRLCSISMILTGTCWILACRRTTRSPRWE